MEKTMLQQVMTAPGIFEYHEVPIPKLKAGQIMVKIMKIGICGSDIHVFYGKHPFTSYPITQGHEVSGEVVALGDGVTQFQIGQKVTIEPQIVCGNCYPCTHNNYNICESLKVLGFQATGMASTYFAIDENWAKCLPDTVSFDEGAMIEPLAVAVHAAKRAPDLCDKKVVVIGAGPIGILVMQALKARGAACVMSTDISNYRLQLAKACGADFVSNTKNVNLGDAMIEAFGPDKADIIYDCAGNNISIGDAIKYARKSSTIILVAVFANIATVDLAVLGDHELTLNTSMMYSHEDYTEAIKLVSEGKVLLKPLMSKTFAFREWLQAYQYIEANRETTMKVLIDVQDV